VGVVELPVDVPVPVQSGNYPVLAAIDITYKPDKEPVGVKYQQAFGAIPIYDIRDMDGGVVIYLTNPDGSSNYP
jgi:hypothetical protein